MWTVALRAIVLHTYAQRNSGRHSASGHDSQDLLDWNTQPPVGLYLTFVSKYLRSWPASVRLILVWDIPEWWQLKWFASPNGILLAPPLDRTSELSELVSFSSIIRRITCTRLTNGSDIQKLMCSSVWGTPMHRLFEPTCHTLRQVGLLRDFSYLTIHSILNHYARLGLVDHRVLCSGIVYWSFGGLFGSPRYSKTPSL